MLDLNEVRPLTDFQRGAREHIRRLRKSGKPLVLTVNGSAEVVVQSATGYQDLLDRLERAETIVAIRVAQGEVERGETMPLSDALATLKRRPGLEG